MTSTVFVDKQTVIESSWLNDVNTKTYADTSDTVEYTPAGTGAVVTTVQTKLRESVSVLDFGADPTGVADSYAAFQAAHDSLSAYGDSRGGTIYVPAGSYILSATWEISKQVSIVGTNAGDHTYWAGSLLTFPANTTGIRFYGSDTPTGSNALESSITNIYLTASAKSATGHGIWSTVTIKVRDCFIRFFKEHGIFINGNTPAQGVADCWQIHSTRITNCDGDGLRLVGNDSQVGTAINCQCVDNGGWGFYDNATYTNTYIACQAAGNDTGDWYNRNATYLGGLYLGCYTESGGITDLDTNCIVIGGVMDYGGANGFLPTSNGIGINAGGAGGRHIFQRNQVEIGRIDTDNIFSGLAGFYADGSGNPADYIYVKYNRISCKSSTSTSAPIYFFNSSGSPEVGSITTSGATTSYNTSSDYRLKENVLPMTGALDTVAKLNPVTFTWKCDGKDGQGFIAHELQAVVPDCVTGEKDAVDEEGKIITQSVDVSFLIATLTKAIQELSAKVAALEAK